MLRSASSPNMQGPMSLQENRLRKEEEVLVALRRIIRATDLHGKLLARETGMTAPQLMLLQMAERLHEPTIGDIAREANLTQATVTTIVERMEKRGLVIRKRNQSDRRKVNVLLTQKGACVLEKAPAMLQNRFVERFLALSDWEQNFILAALQRVGGLMDAGDIDASPVLDTGPLDRPV